MDYNDIFNIIKKIENQEDEALNFLYKNDLINLQNLYRKCASWLFQSRQHEYPKDSLTEIEYKIYSHSDNFFESFVGKDYSAIFCGNRLV